MIKIYDTMARTKREFIPQHAGEVRMYVCGPTVYNYIHIGNARTFISFDVIRRYLQWRGYNVLFVQNITDVDDKIINKAKEENRSAAEVAAEYSQAFIEDMHAAGVMDPDIRPRATEEIPAMIALVQKLIDAGHAYVAEGDVYFSVRSYAAYGQLSNRKVDEMESGHRTLVAEGQGLEERKRDPLDFALWKAAKPGEPAWDSPWGQGRPGWHIECSVMSEKYLGLPFDIHGGGADLVFPHHENERAQSEAACGCTFAQYWMHGGMLQINHEKMSKSLGNFLLLRDILKTTDPYVLRMLMLMTHYRSPLDFSDARLAEAASALTRIETFVKNTEWLCEVALSGNAEVGAPVQAGSGEAQLGAAAQANSAEVQLGAAAQANSAEVQLGGASPNHQTEATSPDRQLAASGFAARVYDQAIATMRTSFTEAMDDDFNTAGALGAVFTFVGEANISLAKAQISPDEACVVRAGAQAVRELLGVFGIVLGAAGALDANASEAKQDAGSAESAALIALAGELVGYEGTNAPEAQEALLSARAEARGRKDFALADAIRDGLGGLGYTIEDTPQGARVFKS